MAEEKYQETLNSLINQELSRGKTLHFTVSTLSMAPLIRPQDTVMVRKEGLGNLKCGDIIVFQRYEEFRTHRLLRKKVFDAGIKLITKGDNSLVIDEPVSEQDFIGKVAAIKKTNRVINLEHPFWRIINLLTGILSYFEGTVYGFLRTIKRYILKFG